MRLVPYVFLIATAASSGTLDDALLQRLSEAPPDEMVPIVVTMADRYPTEQLFLLARGLPKDDARAAIVNALKSHAASAHADLIDALARLETEGAVADVVSIWAANAVSLRATGDAVTILAGRGDVRSVRWDREWPLDRLLDAEGPTRPATPDRGLGWHITRINADDVWDEGYKGEGVLVCVVDTGVNYNHADLADHMWEGGPEFPNHGWNFSGTGPGDADTMDYTGHGTHVAGVLAGDGSAGTGTGVAPDATVMVAKIATESDAWEGWQFALEQGADLCNLSWGWSPDMEPDHATWRSLADVALAAGMLHFKSAGNLGGDTEDYPVPWNVTCPGMVPPPRLHEDQALTGGLSGLLAIGNTDSNDEIRYSSSRGPCTWEGIQPYDDYDYDPEMGLLKPDFTAPGTYVVTCSHSDDAGYFMATGTSIAAPCAAGAAALLLSWNPDLTAAELVEALDEGAVDLGDPGFDNVYGVGRVDPYASLSVSTGVDLEFFRGVRTARGVVLNWGVIGISNGSFNLYREILPADRSSADAGDERVLVNKSPIVGENPFEYVDAGAPEKPMSYWLEYINVSGRGSLYGPVSVGASEPELFRLSLRQNRPNPVKGSTTFEFTLPLGCIDGELAVYDIAGRRVATVFRGSGAGPHTVGWAPVGDDGRRLPAGLYVVVLSATGETAVRKMAVE
jgi:subtilisin family serine protease